jgi:hypothetical protein
VPRRWTEDSIRRELEAFLPGLDVFPTVARRARGWDLVAAVEPLLDGRSGPP